MFVITKTNVGVGDGHSLLCITTKESDDNPLIIIGELAGKLTAVGDELTRALRDNVGQINRTIGETHAR